MPGSDRTRRARAILMPGLLTLLTWLTLLRPTLYNDRRGVVCTRRRTYSCNADEGEYAPRIHNDAPVREGRGERGGMYSRCYLVYCKICTGIYGSYVLWGSLKLYIKQIFVNLWSNFCSFNVFCIYLYNLFFILPFFLKQTRLIVVFHKAYSTTKTSWERKFYEGWKLN